MDNFQYVNSEIDYKHWLVYIHTSPNGKKYIGITGKYPPEKRWDNGYGYGHNQHFTSAIKKYGWDNFKHEIIAYNLSEEDAMQMEKDLIQKYQTMNPDYGYNKTSGGEKGKEYSEETKKKISNAVSGENHPNYGKHHSEETKQKIADGNKNKEVSLETRAKISEANKGRQYSDEYKKHMSDVLMGRITSEETRRKLSEALTGREFSEEHKNNLSEAMKRVWEDEEYKKSRSGENHPFFGSGENNPMFGKHHTQATKDIISAKNKGRTSPNKGKVMPEETKQKISESQRLYWTEEKRKEMSEQRKGKNIGADNPNFGNHKLAGAANPRAKKVVRLFDKKIYDYIGQASDDNNVSRETIVSRCKKHKDFMFYDEYLTQAIQ